MQDAQGREELETMQKTTTAICEWLEAHPESLPKARRFAEYYIPTTLKLLRTYNDVQGQQGENAETIRRDIAGILHTLNQAYSNLYSRKSLRIFCRKLNIPCVIHSLAIPFSAKRFLHSSWSISTEFFLKAVLLQTKSPTLRTLRWSSF